MLHFFYILSGSNFVHPPSPKNFGNFLEYYTTRVVLGYYTTRVVLKVSILALFLWLVDCICCTTVIYFRFSFYCPWMKHFFFQTGLFHFWQFGLNWERERERERVSIVCCLLLQYCECLINYYYDVSYKKIITILYYLFFCRQCNPIHIYQKHRK